MWVQFSGQKIPWRRKWQPTPVFLPGDSHGQKNLEGYIQSMGLQRIGHDCLSRKCHLLQEVFLKEWSTQLFRVKWSEWDPWKKLCWWTGPLLPPWWPREFSARYDEHGSYCGFELWSPVFLLMESPSPGREETLFETDVWELLVTGSKARNCLYRDTDFGLSLGLLNPWSESRY